MSNPLLATGPDRNPAVAAPQATNSPGPKLLDRLRLALETRRYRPDTVGRFVEWNRQYILFHRLRHPQTMGREHIEAFLAHVAQTGYGTELQAQARRALAFLYREVLRQEVAWPAAARLAGQGTPVNAREAAQLQGPKLLDRACGLLRGQDGKPARLSG